MTTSTREMTRRAVLLGIGFGVVFGAANAYLGLRVGMTVATSIPVAIMTVAVLRAFGARAGLLELNTAQTIGSASTSLATGAIFTLPALMMWGRAPSYLQVVALVLCGGVLGVAAMIPLRRLLIVEAAAELPYPEGRACAQVLRTADERSRAGAWILWGLLAGAAIKLAVDLGGVSPRELSFSLPGLPRAEVGVEIAPALFGIGYILGARRSGVLVSGSALAALVFIPLIAMIGGQLAAPLAPATDVLVADMSAGDIWSKYVRYLGAGAVAAAGAVAVGRGLPSMARAVAAVAADLRLGDAGATDRTSRDLPGRAVVMCLIAVAAVLAFAPGVLDAADVGQRAVGAVAAVAFGIVFVAVMSRIAGIVGTSSQPTSGVTILTLLGIGSVFAALGWTSLADRAVVICVGAVVAVAASSAGDTSQDLKTGQLVGATPAVQQLGQLVGMATACWAVAAAILLLGDAFEFGSADLPAPQAMLIKTLVEGILDDSLPWEWLLAGGGVAVAVMLAGVDGLAFSIGLYLPLGAMMPIFIGGTMRRLMDGAAGEDDGDPGVLAASGLVAGEGLAGVGVAVAVGGFGASTGVAGPFAGAVGTVVGVVIVIAVCAFLARASRSR